MALLPEPQPAAPEALDLLIVGAGFGGLYMLIKARAMGLSARVIEAAPSVGGTWYHNRYPGARVDVQSLEYSFSFSDDLQQEWHWKERYASQPELLRYANHVADRFALRDGILLDTRLTAASWHDDSRRWLASAHAGQRWSARFMVLATGPLSTPNTPHFDRLDKFAGRVLHTANWPHETVDFSGQRVGVIGTGSSGMQAIPPIARQARSLTVFQRTAAYVVPAHNGPLDPAFETHVKADYAGFRARNRRMRSGFGCELPPHSGPALAVSAQERTAQYEVRWRIGGFALLNTFSDILTDLRANQTAADFVRSKIRAAVHDPETARRLCPSHSIGCKRLCVDSGGYYETFNQPHVQLVDLNEAPLERFTSDGVVAGGHEHKLDTVVLATGFDAVTGTLMRLQLQGRDGLRIQDKWRDGPLNQLGLMVAGFPNLFNVAGAGSTSAFTSVIVSIEHHVDWIADCIAWLDAQGLSTIDATAEGEARWMAHVLAVAQQTVMLSCNSWYLGANVPGKPRVFMPMAGGFPAYAERCAEVAARGYEGFRLA